MCRILTPCADFKAILTPFSKVFRNRSFSDPSKRLFLLKRSSVDADYNDNALTRTKHCEDVAFDRKLFGIMCRATFGIILTKVARPLVRRGNLDLRGDGTLKYGDVHEKFNFLEIQELRPLRTCQNHFETILPNFLLDECEI